MSSIRYLFKPVRLAEFRHPPWKTSCSFSVEGAGTSIEIGVSPLGHVLSAFLDARVFRAEGEEASRIPKVQVLTGFDKSADNQVEGRIDSTLIGVEPQ